MAKRVEYPDIVRPSKPEDFITKAVGKRGSGHGLVQVAIPIEMLSVMEEVLDKGLGPYRTKADIVRDALYHRLDWLCRNQAPELAGELRSVRLMHRLLEREERNIQRLRDLEQLTKLIETTSDSHDEQVSLIAEFVETLETVVAAYWKGRYMKYLKEHHGALLIEVQKKQQEEFVEGAKEEATEGGKKESKKARRMSMNPEHFVEQAEGGAV